jgi:prophage regulatory protein
MPDCSNIQIKSALVDRLSVFDSLPDSALVDVLEISALAGRSRASIWRDVHDDRLAPPIKIGPNTTRWRVRDVRRFLAGGGS